MNMTPTADIQVSVAMVTYNHEAWIAEAIESVLIQETEFKVELVIGEDCSTDDTRAIVQSYAERFPGRVRLLLHERNQGMMANFAAVLDACRGRYVALLDGDDCWTDRAKLQKQVDFLEGHPECAICFHDVVVVYDNYPHMLRRYCSPNQKQFSSVEDLLTVNCIPACSTVFRRGLFGAFPDWFLTLPLGDWPLHVLNAQHGHAGYINETMAVYRVHQRGAWSHERPKKRIEGHILMYRALDKHFQRRYHRLIMQRIAFSYYQMASIERRQGSKLGVLRNLAIALIVSPTAPPVSYGRLLRKTLHAFQRRRNPARA